jgi:hypothetical protein
MLGSSGSPTLRQLWNRRRRRSGGKALSELDPTARIRRDSPGQRKRRMSSPEGHSVASGPPDRFDLTVPVRTPFTAVVTRRRMLAQMGRALETMRPGDDENNARTRPPEDEFVAWPCMWLCEVYTPSHAASLWRGLSSLGLDEWRAGRDDVATWIRQQRGSPGAWVSGGMFARPGMFIGSGVNTSIRVPEEFSAISLSFHQVFPGVTVLVAQFVLERTEAGQLNATLRRTFRSEARRRGRSYTLHRPGDLKAREISAVRERTRTRGERWIADHLPGAFSALSDTSLPAWDVVTTSQTLAISEDLPRHAWQDALGLAPLVALWRTSDDSGIYLAEPWRERSGAVMTLTSTAAAFARYSHDGGATEDTALYALDSDMDAVMAGAAICGLTEELRRRFVVIRDELGSFSAWRASARVKALRREILPLSLDLVTLQRGSQDDRSLDLLAANHGQSFVEVPLYGRAGTGRSFNETLRTRIATEGRAVAAEASEVADALKVQTDLLLALTNIRLQWMVAALTLVLGAAGLVVALAP